MWFVWFMWGIVDVAIIATIILLTGKGSMLVTGFNTKNAEELTKYDVKKVSRQAGIFMTLIDFGLIGLVSYIQFRAVPAIQDNTISNYVRNSKIKMICFTTKRKCSCTVKEHA